jgi:hypothetical protein
MYGVFSEVGGVVTLHSVHPEPKPALVQLVRYVFFQNYGAIPYEVLHKIAETVERVLDEGKRDVLSVYVNQVEWFTEIVTEDYC